MLAFEIPYFVFGQKEKYNWISGNLHVVVMYDNKNITRMFNVVHVCMFSSTLIYDLVKTKPFVI